MRKKGGSGAYGFDLSDEAQGRRHDRIRPPPSHPTCLALTLCCTFSADSSFARQYGELKNAKTEMGCQMRRSIFLAMLKMKKKRQSKNEAIINHVHSRSSSSPKTKRQLAMCRDLEEGGQKYLTKGMISIFLRVDSENKATINKRQAGIPIRSKNKTTINMGTVHSWRMSCMCPAMGRVYWSSI